MTLHWLTTNPNPLSRPTGFDAGLRGWKLHAVEAVNDSFKETRYVRAACGLLPRHGWALGKRSMTMTMSGSTPLASIFNPE